MINISDVTAMLYTNLNRVQSTHDLDDWHDALWYMVDWSELFADVSGEPAREINTIKDMEKALDELIKRAGRYETIMFYDNEISQHVIDKISQENPNFGFGAEHEYIDISSLVKNFLSDKDYVSVKRNDGEIIWLKERF